MNAIYWISGFILPKRSPLASAGDRGRSFGVLADSRRFSTRLRRELHPIRESDNEEADDGLPYRQFADFLDEDDGENESDGDIDMYEWDETTLYEHFLSDESVQFPFSSPCGPLIPSAEFKKKQSGTN